MTTKQSKIVLKSRAKHRHAYNAYQRRYRADHYKQQHKEGNIKWAAKAYERILFSNAKRSAKRRGLECNLELTDIVIPEHCPIMNTRLTRLHGQGIVDTNASIDRIDSSKGYIKDNVWIISHIANQMKSCATKEQLLAFVNGINKCFSPQI